eukprot:TRINITY_DN9853_c0_g1_i1.p1 TRINITY_DN9853_c0_g1~~TRINITY_DN9853_c0_g1_i1.p1  ORF type:complete len:407 (+),score=105.45 TRINITY_DN9853_c0_g1_i1:220-1440(+)
MGCCASVREPRKERDRFEGMAEFDKSAELGLSPGQSGSHVEVVAPDADKPELLTQEELERAENKRREAAAADKAQEMERRKMARRAEEKMFSDAAEAASSPGVQLTKVFGCTVAEASARSGGGVPSPIWESIRWLSGHGLKTEGLFRIPGRKRAIAYWINRFNVEPTVTIPDDEDVGNVCSIIVNWLKQLKNEEGNKGYLYATRDEQTHEELFNMQAEMQKLRKTGKTPDLAFVRSALERIPQTERTILCGLTGLMSAGCEPENAAMNQMNPYNFAMCTFPEVMAAVQVMIEQHEEVFAGMFPAGEEAGSVLLRCRVVAGQSALSPILVRAKSREDDARHCMSVEDALNRDPSSPGYLDVLSQATNQQRTSTSHGIIVSPKMKDLGAPGIQESRVDFVSYVVGPEA